MDVDGSRSGENFKGTSAGDHLAPLVSNIENFSPRLLLQLCAFESHNQTKSQSLERVFTSFSLARLFHLIDGVCGQQESLCSEKA